MKLRKILAALAGGAVAAAVAVLWAPSAAWADTNPVLNQSGKHILASNPGYDGTDCNGVTAAANQDIWVFVWPGNQKVGTISSVTIGWDTNGDGTADTTRSYPGSGATLITNGTPKIAFVTPAGWRLETGTSTVTGYTSNGKFNLTHTCSGTPDNQVDPCVQNPQDPGCQPPPDDPCLDNPDAPECNPDPCVDTAAAAKPDFCTPPTSDTPTTPTPTTTTTPGLPQTGSSLTGLLVAGAALVAAGGATLFLLRRRRAAVGE